MILSEQASRDVPVHKGSIRTPNGIPAELTNESG
jgi:hypothetical protein